MSAILAAELAAGYGGHRVLSHISLAAGAGDGVYVLPGTHSKWARVEAGRIVGFETFMTGEMFELLARNSLDGRILASPAVAGRARRSERRSPDEPARRG